jgi:hypothetical protein
MGVNRRKMEPDRKATADSEAAVRRASEAQVFQDVDRLVAAWNERQAKRMPVLFSPTIGAAIAARYWYMWVHVGTLPGLPDHSGYRPAHARSSPRCRSDEPDPVAVVPLLPAERAVCRTRALITDQHRRRNADRAHTPGARRVSVG